MGFTFSIKKDRAISEWRNEGQSNCQILMLKIWKQHPDKKCLL